MRPGAADEAVRDYTPELEKMVQALFMAMLEDVNGLILNISIYSF